MAAEEESEAVMYSLVYCYEHDRGIQQDYSMAYQWYLKAAKKENFASVKSLACCYKDGKGVAADKEKADLLFAAKNAQISGGRSRAVDLLHQAIG